MPENKKIEKQEEPEKQFEQFSDEGLVQVSGGKSAFTNVPRVPLKDYDDEVKKNI
ncbi:hypothetical protein [Petroclostridium sp. X23]|uniref:hypothetical protein n=1 Tax=Petroclostridium sp. X23 TaxID=3045146 RepID=UPI0024AD2F0C|nr:hypothetical protein [Petroclostridium sp. X23]WHH59532.1 hypothetical protein QKW49_01840 [Petroclostridium sp. X23]